MKNNVALIERALFILGGTGILIGLLIMLVSVLMVAPKFSRGSAELDRILALADSAVTSLQQGSPVLATSVKTLKSAANLVRALPETLSATRGTLTEAAAALNTTAQAVNETKKGLAGLVLPKVPLGVSASRFAKTSQQMRLLTGMLFEIQKASAGLSQNLTALSVQTSALLAQPGRRDALPVLKQDIALTRSALQGTSWGWLSFAVGALFGGFYVLLGSTAIALVLGFRSLRTQGVPQRVQAAERFSRRPAA